MVTLHIYRLTRLNARRKDSPLIAPMIPVGEDGQVQRSLDVHDFQTLCTFYSDTVWGAGCERYVHTSAAQQDHLCWPKNQ